VKRIIFILLVLSVLLCSCAPESGYANKTFFAMNTVVNTVVSEQIIGDTTDEVISDIEKRMSRTLTDSEISRLNNGGEVTLSDDTMRIIEKSLQIAKDTDFAFNPCMGTLADLWDITSGRNTVPSDEKIEEALSLCDASLVEISDGRVIIPDGMKIDLGGVAKGYALQRASEKLDEKAKSSMAGADFCISLGGNVAVSGTSPSRKENARKGWSVGITNPFEKGEIIGTVTLTHGCVSVSGGYERFFEKDGKTYHHIFDSKTGYPSDSGLASAAVISDDGLEADALSTALFVMGREKAVEFYKKGIYDFEMLLVTDEKEIVVSSNIYEKMNITAAENSGFSVVEIIE